MTAQTTVLFDAPGPRAKRLYALIALASAVVAALVLWFVIDRLGDNGQLEGAKWSPFLTGEIWTVYLIPGILGTLKAAGISIVLALALGFLLGVGRLSEHRWIRTPCGAIVEFFRAVPVLLLMIFSYNVYVYYNLLPSAQFALAGVVTGLTFYNGAVVAELVRSGVKSLPRGQSEAAKAIGLRPGPMMRLVLLPQAVTAMLPAIVSQLVVVLKDSALGYIITYNDLLQQVQLIGSYKVNILPTFFVVAAIFILMNWLLTVAARKVEERLRRRGHSAGGPIAPDAGAAVGAVGATGAAVAITTADSGEAGT
jgi:glutamate transport system permease protein